MRRHCQMVFQDPYSALNPRLTVGQIVAEPMQAQGMNRADITARVEELLDLVGLQPRRRNAFPHQFSGGQRQRIGTARALSTHPEVLISTSRSRPSTSRCRPRSSTCSATCRSSSRWG